jgi:hypothetical protein
MKKKSLVKKNQKPIMSNDLKMALEIFPDIVKRNQKAARFKNKIIKNFLSVSDEIWGKPNGKKT